MALIATVGAANANSYPTVPFAANYFANRAYGAAWEAVADPELLLMTASQMIDWYITPAGLKATDAQSMNFPRIGIYTENGNEMDSTVLPNCLLVGTCELAFVLKDKDRTVANPLNGLAEVRAGGLSIRTDSSANAGKEHAIPENVQKILAPVTQKGGIRTVHLIRA